VGVLVNARGQGRWSFSGNRAQIKPEKALRACETVRPEAKPQKTPLILYTFLQAGPGVECRLQGGEQEA
jgi:hypothetical protein